MSELPPIPFYPLPSRAGSSHPLQLQETRDSYYEIIIQHSVEKQLLPLRKLREAYVQARSYEHKVWKAGLHAAIETKEWAEAEKIAGRMKDSQYFNYGILLRICGHRDTYHLAKVLSQFPQPYSTQHEYLLEARRVIHGSIINWTRYQKLYQEGDHIQRAILESISDQMDKRILKVLLKSYVKVKLDYMVLLLGSEWSRHLPSTAVSSDGFLSLK